MSVEDSAPYQGEGTDRGKRLEQLEPETSENSYELLTGYGFARRYAGEKRVADIGWERVGYGSQLLAGTAESVVGMASSAEAVDLASAVYPAPNVGYRQCELPKLPQPEDYFDVVVALGIAENLDSPEDLIRETRRVLNPDGVLIVSVPDKQAYVENHDTESPGYQRGMRVTAFREMLERHYQDVLLYRQGAIAGGIILPSASGEITSASTESASLSLTNVHPGTETPVTRSILAVCGGAGTLEREEKPYVLLDRERRVFDECEDRAEDVALLRKETRRMQETEVQAFQDAYKIQRNENAYLRARIRRSEKAAKELQTHLQTRNREL